METNYKIVKDLKPGDKLYSVIILQKHLML